MLLPLSFLSDDLESFHTLKSLLGVIGVEIEFKLQTRAAKLVTRLLIVSPYSVPELTKSQLAFAR
jgi:hypothetical protein